MKSNSPSLRLSSPRAEGDLFFISGGPQLDLCPVFCNMWLPQASTFFTHVRFRRMVMGSWGSAGKEQLSAVPIFTFASQCLSRSHPSTSGWTGSWLLCLFPSNLLLLKLSALGYADGCSYLAYTFAMFCCTMFSGRDCWCKQFWSGTLYKKKPCT